MPLEGRFTAYSLVNEDLPTEQVPEREVPDLVSDRKSPAHPGLVAIDKYVRGSCNRVHRGAPVRCLLVATEWHAGDDDAHLVG